MSKYKKNYCVSYTVDNDFDNEKNYYCNSKFLAKSKFFEYCHSILNFGGAHYYNVSLYSFDEHKCIMKFSFYKEK